MQPLTWGSSQTNGHYPGRIKGSAATHATGCIQGKQCRGADPPEAPTSTAAGQPLGRLTAMVMTCHATVVAYGRLQGAIRESFSADRNWRQGP